MARNQKQQREASEFEERVVFINRVAKTVKGGRRMSLVALVVVGDGKGNVGLGMGKSAEVPLAISKATIDAKKNMFHVPVTEERAPSRTRSSVTSVPVASSSSPLSMVPASSPAVPSVRSSSSPASRTSCPSPWVPTTASTSSRPLPRASRSFPALRTSRLAVASPFPRCLSGRSSRHG